MSVQDTAIIQSLIDTITERLATVENLAIQSQEPIPNAYLVLNGIHSTLEGLIRSLRHLPEPTPEPADF